MLWTIQGDSTWFFSSENTVCKSALLIIIIILSLREHQGLSSSGMCSKNTWGQRDSALNHPGWQHMIFFFLQKLSFPRTNGKLQKTEFSQEQTASCKGPLGAARAAQLCSGGWPQSIDYIPKSKGGTCHCRRFVPSLVVLLRPIESDYSRVPNVAPPSPPPEICGYPKKRLIFGPF